MASAAASSSAKAATGAPARRTTAPASVLPPGTSGLPDDGTGVPVALPLVVEGLPVDVRARVEGKREQLVEGKREQLVEGRRVNGKRKRRKCSIHNIKMTAAQDPETKCVTVHIEKNPAGSVPLGYDPSESTLRAMYDALEHTTKHFLYSAALAVNTAVGFNPFPPVQLIIRDEGEDEGKDMGDVVVIFPTLVRRLESHRHQGDSKRSLYQGTTTEAFSKDVYRFCFKARAHCMSTAISGCFNLQPKQQRASWPMLMPASVFRYLMCRLRQSPPASVQPNPFSLVAFVRKERRGNGRWLFNDEELVHMTREQLIQVYAVIGIAPGDEIRHIGTTASGGIFTELDAVFDANKVGQETDDTHVVHVTAELAEKNESEKLRARAAALPPNNPLRAALRDKMRRSKAAPRYGLAPVMHQGQICFIPMKNQQGSDNSDDSDDSDDDGRRGRHRGVKRYRVGSSGGGGDDGGGDGDDLSDLVE